MADRTTLKSQPSSGNQHVADAFYAHSENESNEWQGLTDHLQAVASQTAEFASAFDASDLGYWVGLWHDVGKFSTEFQSYLRRKRPSVDHRRAGARLAKQHCLDAAAILIQGHHGGLQSRQDYLDWLDDPDRAKPECEIQAARRARQFIDKLTPKTEVALPNDVEKNVFEFEIFMRLLFSALVDADFLDTEAHFNSIAAKSRIPPIQIPALWEKFEAAHRELDASGEYSPVNVVRKELYTACLAAADGPPGMYKLTAPTGTGKTLSAMAFALRHAKRHGLQRVIVATPYISITQQTAAVYRAAFQNLGHAVLEHHSGNFELDREESRIGSESAKLAAENWGASVVVTTAVQLLESLFGNKPSRSRKVHRLAGSVLIFDEAQALPTHLLKPTLSALRALTTVGRSSVVLSTATQPSFESIPAFRDINSREIAPELRRNVEPLRRVHYEWRLGERWSWGRVAEEMQSMKQSLVIVNTRKDAMDLLDAFGDNDTLHLSTRLCGAHRLAVIEKVKLLLENDLPCRLVATQVVEAGVDLDFPLVLRAIGPLDSIIQAAGRCNREGELDGLGRVVVFLPKRRQLPGGSYKTATDITEALVNEDGFYWQNPEAMAAAYFSRLLGAVSLDREGIQGLRKKFDFNAVAQKYQLIEPGGEPVAVTTYGTKAKRRQVTHWLNQLNQGRANRRKLRRLLQPYLVNLYPGEAAEYRAQGLLSGEPHSTIEPWPEYDEIRGLISPKRTHEALIA
jgi:CRISPR-associated endonuclease/helicase Cas3